MKKLILQWFEKIACHHEWMMHKEVEVYASEKDELPVKTKQTLICKKCGKIKRITL